VAVRLADEQVQREPRLPGLEPDLGLVVGAQREHRAGRGLDHRRVAAARQHHRHRGVGRVAPPLEEPDPVVEVVVALGDAVLLDPQRHGLAAVVDVEGLAAEAEEVLAGLAAIPDRGAVGPEVRPRRDVDRHPAAVGEHRAGGDPLAARRQLEEEPVGPRHHVLQGLGLAPRRAVVLLDLEGADLGLDRGRRGAEAGGEPVEDHLAVGEADDLDPGRRLADGDPDAFDLEDVRLGTQVVAAAGDQRQHHQRAPH